jgi:hypothetical protein
MGTRASAAVVALMAALLPATPSNAAPAAPTVTADLSRTTGPVMYGANGSLYGPSDDGVPSDNLLQPLKIRTIAQPPPFGQQHPNGYSDVVAPAFVRNGGQDVVVYIQDAYSQWPYQNLGLADYLPKVEAAVRTLSATPQRSHFVYMPFNEPDWIWYGLNVGDPAQYARNRDRFLADWQTTFHDIRSIDPQARIAGPNEAYYDARFYPDFLAWARDHGVLPDVITWHELSPSFMSTWWHDYDSYRALEKALGVGPLPINIDEFGNRRDLSVPGQLVQWVARFEAAKVDADQAYWDIAGNLADTTVETNKPNGAWWFYQWYADMSGQTVEVTPPDANAIDSLQGLASLDTATRQAQVLVGGVAGSSNVVVTHVDPALFGQTVRVTVSRTTWSGYDADAPAPVVLSDRDVPLSNGMLTIPLTGMDVMAAYRIVLEPGGGGTGSAIDLPWSASYEAENASIVDATVFTQGTLANPNGYATSGAKDVGSIDKPDSSVTFHVAVPESGAYRLSILYGNQTGTISQQVLRVDGASPQFVDYPATLNWTFRGRKDVTLHLSGGAHDLTLATSDPSLGAAIGQAGLDRIDLTAVRREQPPQRYEAELAQPEGDVRYQYEPRGQSGAGYVVLGDGGARTTFDVYAPSDGYYDLGVRYSAAGGSETAGAQLTLGGEVVDGATLPTTGDRWQVSHQRVFLAAGVNRVGVVRTGRSPVAVDVLDVSGTPVSGPARDYQAESSENTLTGAAAVVVNRWASGGAYVGGIGGGAANTLTFGEVTAPRAGQYVLAVRYANNERAGSGNYNTNIVSRAADISVGGQAPTRVMFRNTYSWDQFWSVDVPVTLSQGANTVTFSNSTTMAPNIDSVEVAPLLAADEGDQSRSWSPSG